ELGAVEIEVEPVDLAGEHGGVLIYLVKGEPILPRLKRLGSDERGELGYRAGVKGIELLLIAQLGRLEERLPVEAGRLFGELVRGPDFLRLRPVVAFGTGGMGLGDLDFEIPDTLRLSRGIGDPGGGQHVFDVLTVRRL